MARATIKSDITEDEDDQGRFLCYASLLQLLHYVSRAAVGEMLLLIQLLGYSS